MADMVHGEEERGEEWNEEENCDEGGDEEEGGEEDREVIDYKEEEEKGGDEEGIRERDNDEIEVAENAEEYEKTLDSLRRILVATVTNRVIKTEMSSSSSGTAKGATNEAQEGCHRTGNPRSSRN